MRCSDDAATESSSWTRRSGAARPATSPVASGSGSAHETQQGRPGSAAASRASASCAQCPASAPTTRILARPVTQPARKVAALGLRAPRSTQEAKSDSATRARRSRSTLSGPWDRAIRRQPAPRSPSTSQPEGALNEAFSSRRPTTSSYDRGLAKALSRGVTSRARTTSQRSAPESLISTTVESARASPTGPRSKSSLCAWSRTRSETPPCPPGMPPLCFSVSRRQRSSSLFWTVAGSAQPSSRDARTCRTMSAMGSSELGVAAPSPGRSVDGAASSIAAASASTSLGATAGMSGGHGGMPGGHGGMPGGHGGGSESDWGRSLAGPGAPGMPRGHGGGTDGHREKFGGGATLARAAPSASTRSTRSMKSPM